MQRKPAPGFPANSCSIRMPEGLMGEPAGAEEQEGEQQHRRQQLINFAHSHWGFNNWSWAVTKQELDFVDFSNGRYSAGVVAFVSVTVKSLDIRREDIGYATVQANMKGSAIFQARKCAVTNALRETLLSFGANIATELSELLESHKVDAVKPQLPDVTQENNQNIANKMEPSVELKNMNSNSQIANSRIPNIRKDSSDSGGSRDTPAVLPVARSPNKNTLPPPPVKPALVTLPVAKTQPMPANQPPPLLAKPTFPANQMAPKPQPPPPAPTAPLAHVRPNSNVSFVLQPMMPGVLPPLYAQPQPQPLRMPLPHQHVYSNYYEYTPWDFAYAGYERHHGNVNLNFNIPPKNLVVNSRAGTVECKNSCSPGKASGEGEHAPHVQHPHPASFHHHGGTAPACWIKPTIFYDGFWTEQKVKKWVAEQVEKQFPDDTPLASASPAAYPHPPAPHNDHSKQ